MIKVIVIFNLLLGHFAMAAGNGLELAHWLPSLQLNLYDESKELDKQGMNTPELIQAQNQKALSNLQTTKFKKDKLSKRNAYVKRVQAQELLEQLRSDPVAGRSAADIYDLNGDYGFCFGRANWVWLEALKLGIAKDSIKKIFLVGSMKTEGINWQFHVATAIRSQSDQFFFKKDVWYVIDSNFRQIVDVDTFYAFYLKYSTDKKLRLFVSNPKRLGPSSRQKFGPAHFRNSNYDREYSAYFEDMHTSISHRINFETKNQCRHLFPTSKLSN